MVFASFQHHTIRYISEYFFFCAQQRPQLACTFRHVLRNLASHGYLTVATSCVLIRSQEALAFLPSPSLSLSSVTTDSLGFSLTLIVEQACMRAQLNDMGG